MSMDAPLCVKTRVRHALYGGDWFCPDYIVLGLLSSSVVVPKIKGPLDALVRKHRPGFELRSALLARKLDLHLCVAPSQRHGREEPKSVVFRRGNRTTVEFLDTASCPAKVEFEDAYISIRREGQREGSLETTMLKLVNGEEPRRGMAPPWDRNDPDVVDISGP